MPVELAREILRLMDEYDREGGRMKDDYGQRFVEKLKNGEFDSCKSCEHTEDECDGCYPELGYKNSKLKRDTEAVKEFVESDAFKKLMESFDKQDRAATEDAEQFLRDIKVKEQDK